jgi:hypothetical protein
MGTGVIGGPHDFLPDRSDEFQKLGVKESLYILFVMRKMILSSEKPPKN